MLRIVKKFWTLEIVRFGIVGVLNTLIGTGVMFFAYNALHLGYWISSALNYIMGSIFSYFANKYFTFQKTGRSYGEVLRFIFNIAVCYLIAYGLAKPLISKILMLFSWNPERRIYEQISMVAGMGLFVLLNFVGQKLMVFKEH